MIEAKTDIRTPAIWGRGQAGQANNGRNTEIQKTHKQEENIMTREQTRVGTTRGGEKTPSGWEEDEYTRSAFMRLDRRLWTRRRVLS